MGCPGTLRPLAGGEGDGRHFETTAQFQLLEHVVDVALHRVQPDVEARSNGPITQPLRKEFHHFAFARRQWRLLARQRDGRHANTRQLGEEYAHERLRENLDP